MMELGGDSDEKDGADVSRHGQQVGEQDDGEEDESFVKPDKINSVTTLWFSLLKKTMGHCDCLKNTAVVDTLQEGIYK